VKRLVADVHRGLDSALLGEDHVARRDVALDVVEAGPLAPRVGLEPGGHLVARDLDHDVVVVVPVEVRLLAGFQTHLPDTHPVVLHHELRRDVTDDAVVGHASPFPTLSWSS
jgi:hypothetical protein